MAISVNHFIVGIYRGVPVGSDAGAADVDDAVTTVVEDLVLLLGALLVPIRARRPFMMLVIAVRRSVESAGVPVLKISVRQPLFRRGTRRPSPHPCILCQYKSRYRFDA
jgi:hypothetical protein